MNHLSVVCLSICNEKLGLKTTLMQWDISFAKKLIFLSVRRNFKINCVKKLLSDCNWICTQNHLVRKRALNHLESSCSCSCSHLTFRFCACFGKRVPWHSGNYRLWIHFETRTWHGKNYSQLKSHCLKCTSKYLIHAFLYVPIRRDVKLSLLGY